MDDMQDTLELLSAIPALELARLRRRVVFLEAALTQVLRDRAQLREWFTAAELAAMALPGLPRTRNGVTQMAQARSWETMIGTGRGGERRLFHFGSLPRRAFEAMIDLVLRSAPPVAPEGRAPVKVPAMQGEMMTVPALLAATPAWVLPLMRLVRREHLPLDAALQRLPERIGASVRCPTLDEAADVLRALGLMKGVG